MKFETVKIGNNIRVFVNGVMSPAFVRQSEMGTWVIKMPRVISVFETAEEATTLIAKWLGDWHTAAQAAVRLVEMGVFDEPPSAQRMTKWCRDGLLPGAFKLLGPGARGSGGAWRIPEAALKAFAERRKEQ